LSFLSVVVLKAVSLSYLQRLVGVYELAGQEVTFAFQGSVSTLAVPGYPLYELVPDRGDEFDLKGVSGYSVRFTTRAQGAVTASFNQPNGVFELKRKGKWGGCVRSASPTRGDATCRPTMSQAPVECLAARRIMPGTYLPTWQGGFLDGSF
jgi:hypothetical protein